MDNSGLLYHPIALPGITIPGNIFLAPLAGYTDRTFRAICRDFGADLTYTEMVSVEGIFYNSEKTKKLFRRTPEEQSRAIQIFMSKPDHLPEAALVIVKEEPVLIDINCGCPVPKVIKTGAGAALMQSPEKIGALVRTLKNVLEALNHPIPISVKLRSGFDTGTINYLSCAEEAVKAGASLICLHPRTRTQGYSGKANWDHIKKLKASTSVPVFGSGDLFTPEAALAMLKTTGCDGVMIARGAMGNPFIFQQIKELLTQGTALTVPGPTDKINAAIRHLEIAQTHAGTDVLPGEMKKHLLSYTKGLPDSAALRSSLATCGSIGEILALLQNYFRSVLSAR